MALPFKALDAVTSTGSGVEKDLETSMGRHTVYAIATGDPDSFDVRLQGSLDGDNWVTLATASKVATAPIAIASADTHVVRFVRADLANISGGTSPTVTAWVASAG